MYLSDFETTLPYRKVRAYSCNENYRVKLHPDPDCNVHKLYLEIYCTYFEIKEYPNSKKGCKIYKTVKTPLDFKCYLYSTSPKKGYKRTKKFCFHLGLCGHPNYEQFLCVKTFYNKKTNQVELKYSIDRHLLDEGTRLTPICEVEKFKKLTLEERKTLLDLIFSDNYANFELAFTLIDNKI